MKEFFGFLAPGAIAGFYILCAVALVVVLDWLMRVLIV